MSIEIKQGVNEVIEMETPFDPSLLATYTADIYQGGDAVITKSNTACTISGRTITMSITAAEAAKLSPQRFSINFRGVYADGGTIIIEDIPGTIRRSNYRGG